MSEGAPQAGGAGGLVPRRTGGLARLAASALRRSRRRLGILGALEEERDGLLGIAETLDTDAVFFPARTDPAFAPDARPVDLFLALHAEACRAATGATLPHFAPVVCAFDEKWGLWQMGPYVPVRFAPLLFTRIQGGHDDLRAILTDGLILRRYMQDHPDDAGPYGRPLRPGDVLDVLCVCAEGMLPSRMARDFRLSRLPRADVRSGRPRAGEGWVEPPVVSGGAVKVRERRSAEEALVAFEERPPDLLWTNFTLPQASGCDALQTLRARTRHRIPSVIDARELGCYDEDCERAISSACGALAVLSQGAGDAFTRNVFHNAARMRRAFVHAGAP